MFTQITVTTSTDTQGNEFTSIRRYDTSGKHTGRGHMYRTSNVQRIHAALRSMGFHFMYRTGNGSQWGKLLS